MFHAAKDFLKFCEDKDYGMQPNGEPITYSAKAVWDWITEVDESWVKITNQTGEYIGIVYIMQDGINTCGPEETIVDYTSGLDAIIESLETDDAQ